MHRFYLPPAECQGERLSLSDREAHHAIHVLRMKRGDAAVVLDGVGSILDCEVAEVGKRQCVLQVVKRSYHRQQPFLITLIQAIPKGKAMEGIIQKATELGTHRIVPLVSERTNVFLDGDSAGAKQSKWQQTAIEAIKQCGSPWLTTVAAPTTPAEQCSSAEKFDLSLIASLQPDSTHPREVLARCRLAPPGTQQACAIWIGPEGDFSPEEYRSIQANGAIPISLGPLVLRSETAAIYSLSILNYETQQTGRPAPIPAPR